MKMQITVTNFVGFSIIKPTCFHGGSTSCYFEILGEKLDELPAFPVYTSGILPYLGTVISQYSWNYRESILNASSCPLWHVFVADRDVRMGMAGTFWRILALVCVVRGPAASASSEHMLEMQNLRLHPDQLNQHGQMSMTPR
jgi:hypothetical protein